MVQSESDARGDLHLTKLIRMMVGAGVRQLYVKRLAPNDNSKNQFYLAPDLSPMNLIPSHDIETTKVKSRSKKKGGIDEEIFKAHVDFSWIDDEGGLCPAPYVQMIFYPQYPELRMSSFLEGCRRGPSAILASRDPGRVLFLGVTGDGRVIGYAAGPDTAVVRELDGLGALQAVGVFSVVPIDRDDPRDDLLRELRRIHLLDWIDSKRLVEPGVLGPCKAPNCGGYTLEAEFGITPNGFSEPDYRGWELKQHAVTDLSRVTSGVLTLMTPEPTGGYYREHGPEEFVRKFGYPDRLGRADRLNFGGLHRAGVRHPTTALTLTLVGYDPERARIIDLNGGIALVADDGGQAAIWSYPGLISHWQRKHARAAFVPSQLRRDPHLQYRYGSKVRLGEGTDFLRFLASMASGSVYYDPGIKLEGATTAHPKIKRRSQFRVRSSNLPALYTQMTEVSVI